MSILTVGTVTKLFGDCLFTQEEVGAAVEPEQPADAVQVEGVLRKFAFHPGRLESHREEVKALLAELPDNFQASKGGGWTFLNACVTKGGEQWGEHAHCEMLLTLGIGLGLAKWQLPRDMWRVLPGGMPYVVVL